MTHMDIGGPNELLMTIAKLVAAGHELCDVLMPFTSNPARLLRLASKGRVAVAADADLVVLDDQLRATGVMAGGAWHVRDGALVQRGTFEA
jgi:beta-aspartyl-dipeptidase (metallo-type)